MKRYSDRLAWTAPKNSHSLLLDERRKRGSLVDLSVTNPTEGLANYPHAEIARALGAINDFTYEPAALGSRRARQTIHGWYAAQGIAAAEERIALTASTSEAYSALFKLLCDPGDEILVPNPSYPLFEHLAGADGVRAIPYRLGYDGGWFVEIDSVRRAVSERARAIIVVNPNNPTGSFLKTHELKQLQAIAAERGLAIVADEVFMSYPACAMSDRVRSLIGHDEILTFSLNGLSKAAGMPQMKLGWIVVSGPADEAERAIARLDLLLDNYLSVGTPVQQALGPLLRIGGEIQAAIDIRLRQNRETLAALGDGSVTALASEGGWSAILRMPRIKTEDEWITELVANHALAVQPGYFYDMAHEAFLVLSLLSDPESFAWGVGTLKSLADKC